MLESCAYTIYSAIPMCLVCVYGCKSCKCKQLRPYCPSSDNYFVIDDVVCIQHLSPMNDMNVRWPVTGWTFIIQQGIETMEVEFYVETD